MLAILRAAEAAPHVETIALGVAAFVAVSMFVAFAAFHIFEQRGHA